MLPKAHAFYGAILSIAVWFLYPNFIIPALLIFLSNIFIDVDHYMWYVIKKKDWSLKNAYYYLKSNSTIPNQLMLFHTVEFLIFTGFLSFIWFGFYYILVGMLYHSIFDIIDMAKTNNISCREYSLIYYFIKKYKT